MRPPLLLVDDSADGKQLIRLEADDAVAWSMLTTPDPRSVQVLDDGTAVLSVRGGWLVVDLELGEVVDDVGGFSDVQSVYRQDDGTFMVASEAQGGIELTTADAAGVGLSKIALSGYRDVRIVRPTGDGWLVPAIKAGPQVVELDDLGISVWQADLPAAAMMAERLADGTTVVSTGSEIVRVDAAGVIHPWLGGSSAPAELGLASLGGFVTLGDGTTVVANWLGQSAAGSGAHLVAFTDDNEVAWSWADHEVARQISNVVAMSR